MNVLIEDGNYFSTDTYIVLIFMIEILFIEME